MHRSQKISSCPKLETNTSCCPLAAAVQESSSEDVVGLPQRCAKVNALLDNLLLILWLIQPKQTPLHRRPQPRCGLANDFER